MEQNKLEFYNKQIVELFKKCKISSITVNGFLYDDYSHFSEVEKIDKIIINKKYIKEIKLLDPKDEKFIIENYISNSELLVKNDKTGRYIKMKISDHSRKMFITRYLLLLVNSKINMNDYFNTFNILIHRNFLSLLDDHTLTNVVYFKDRINVFIKRYTNEIDKQIYKMYTRSKVVKEKNKFYNDRNKRYGDTIFYNSYPFLIVYNPSKSIVETIEIFNNNKRNTMFIIQELNKLSHDPKSFINKIKDYIKNNIKENRLIYFNKTL